MDVELVLKEELFFGKLNWYGVVFCIKLRNLRYNFVIFVGKNGNFMLSMLWRYIDLGK